MEQCLLCDINSVPRNSGNAPICEPHRQDARRAFERAEPHLRTHLEHAFGAELDGWVRRGQLPGLAWHLKVRDQPSEPTREFPRGGPGRPVHLRREPEAAVRRLRELVVAAMVQVMAPHEDTLVLRVGAPDGRRTANVDATTHHQALVHLVAELITVDRLRTALDNLPTDAAGRHIIEATVHAETEADELVGELGVLSPGARALAFVRLLDPADTLLVDPVELAGEAEGGSAEFTRGWWEIRDRVPEPGRQWVELLEARFARARQRQ